MNSPAPRMSARMPGGPPGDFQEWDGNHEVRGNGKARETDDSEVEDSISLPSIYGSFDVPLCGPQYGFSSLSLRQQTCGAVKRPRTQVETLPLEASQTRGFTSQDSNSSQPGPSSRVANYSRKLDGSTLCNTTRAPYDAQSPSRNLSHGSSSANERVPFAPRNVIEGPAPTSCIICTEDFSSTTRRPPWISSNCLHHPSVCHGCLEESIKIDLDSKIWNQIKCPECGITLIYDDIRRLADPDTFARYDTLSFRSAVGGDSNFVWCQKCDFGQLHGGGELHPIICCLKCGFRSCFRHSVPWHDHLTCDEYDEMIQDPDGFQSAIDREDEAAREARIRQEDEDQVVARDMDQRERQVEQDRQRQIHDEQLRRARAEQEAEARRMRDGLERSQKRELMKRKQQEEALSLQKVQATTKPCPGCRWPIEKNRGCSHMTCIKCHAEFCWVCLNDYQEIRRHGNSRHKETCTFHTTNLP